MHTTADLGAWLRSRSTVNRRQIRAITFDLDDTLWPIMPVIEQAEAALAEWLQEHCPRVLQRYADGALLSLREQVARDHPDLAHDFSALRRLAIHQALTECGYCESLVDPAFDVFFEQRQQVTVFDDVVPAFERLSRHFRLAAITNGNADLSRMPVGRWFEFSIHARAIGHAKPSPRIFEAAAARFDLPPAAILHVGDHPEQDVQGALAAGFHAIWIDRAESDEATSVPVVRCLRTLADRLGV